MVQPAAIAGATLQAIWFSGQFQGVMKPQTPADSLTIRVLPRSSNSKSSGFSARSSHATANLRCFRQSHRCAFLSRSRQPSSFLPLSPAIMFPSTFLRVSMLEVDQEANAALAFAAPSTSAAVPMDGGKGLFVAGLLLPAWGGQARPIHR